MHLTLERTFGMGLEDFKAILKKAFTVLKKDGILSTLRFNYKEFQNIHSQYHNFTETQQKEIQEYAKEQPFIQEFLEYTPIMVEFALYEQSRGKVKMRSTEESNTNGQTRLMIALKFRHYDIVKNLLQDEINVYDKKGRNVLWYFMFHLQNDALNDPNVKFVAQTLIEKTNQDDLNVFTDGKTPLMIASERDNNLVNMLLAKGVIANMKNRGHTALNYAVRAGKEDVVKTLIEIGGLMVNAKCLVQAMSNPTQSSMILFLLDNVIPARKHILQELSVPRDPMSSPESYAETIKDKYPQYHEKIQEILQQ